MNRLLTHDDCFAAARVVAKHIQDASPSDMERHWIKAFAIPRGGVPVLYMLQGLLPRIIIVSRPEEADVIVDDLIQSGATRARWHSKNPDAMFVVLFSKQRSPDPDQVYGAIAPPDDWLVFPWEAEVAHSASDVVTRQLQFIGENPEREGLKETPGRVIKAWGKWFEGYKVDPKEVFKTFEDGSEGYDQMLVQRNIPLYSHCEHHLAPFFGVAHIAYIPSKKIVGLSKLSRLLDVFAHRLQVQERLTTQVADSLVENLSPQGVAVVLECRHLCMESRGIQRAGTTTTTSAVRGLMKESPAVRAEFFSLLKG